MIEPLEIHTPLLPLRRKIRRSFFALVTLYAILGIFMMVSVFLAAGTTPKVVHLNYDSIAAAIQMREAWNALESPELHPRKSRSAWAEQFDSALGFSENNLTEQGENEVVRNIRKIWDQKKSAPTHADFQSYNTIDTYLSDLITLNEKGMFSLSESSAALGRKVFLFSILFFIVTLALAVLLSDGLANRLARPIKDIAEALRGNPELNYRLKLPQPTSLEIRILTDEVSDLWKRLSKFRELNIEELSAERERLETVLSSVEDAVLVLDNEGRVRQLSEGMLRILNIQANDVIGHPWLALSSVTENYLKLRDQLKGELGNESFVTLSEKGRAQIYAARHRDIITPSNQKIGALYLLHDITESRQRERLKSEFIGVLSHELKTPLQSLGTAAELLAGRTNKMDDDTKMLVETINEDVSRIRAVANDFMQVSVVDLHSLKLKFEKLPLSQLLKNWIKPFRVLARDKSVQLEFLQEGDQTIWANIDVVKLPWAISNLLANAIRVSPQNSKVTVMVSSRSNAPGMAEIEIKDEGPGISENTQAHMFEPYYQAAPSESGTSAGFLGLGLTIAKEVVEAHDGRIDYFPRRPHGSTFRILIPHVTVYV